MRGCLGHLTLLQTPGAALWAGDLLHHVAESHLAKTSEESAGLKPHKCDAWNQTDSLLSPNIQDSDSANSSSYTAWELMAVWPCRLARELNATGQLRKPLQQNGNLLPETPWLPYASGPLSCISSRCMKSSCSSYSWATYASAKGLFSLIKLKVPYTAVAEQHPLVILLPLPLREPGLLAQVCGYPPNTYMYSIQGSNTPINTLLFTTALAREGPNM